VLELLLSAVLLLLVSLQLRDGRFVED